MTAIVALSALNSVIWACLRYSSSLAFSTGKRDRADIVFKRLAIDAGDTHEPAEADGRAIETHSAIDVRNALGAQPIDDQKTRRPVIDGNEDEIELLQTLDVFRCDAFGYRLDPCMPLTILLRERFDLELADGPGMNPGSRKIVCT